jgi:hypothetical protein
LAVILNVIAACLIFTFWEENFGHSPFNNITESILQSVVDSGGKDVGKQFVDSGEKDVGKASWILVKKMLEIDKSSSLSLILTGILQSIFRFTSAVSNDNANKF